MMVKYILKRTIQYFFSRCFYFFFLFLWYYVRLFQIHLFSIHFFLMILYLVRVKSTPLIVTQSATEQFVQKHSCTSVSHFASNHPLQRRELSWPSIKPVSLSAISCIDVYAAKRNWRNESRAFTRANIAQRETCDVALCSLPLGTLDLQWSGFFSQWLF